MAAARALERTVAALRAVNSPGDLHALAAAAVRLLWTMDHPGAAAAALCTLSHISARIDGEPLSPDEWTSFQGVAHSLAALLAAPSVEAFDRVGMALRATMEKPQVH
jgi:hypothetical protein